METKCYKNEGENELRCDGGDTTRNGKRKKTFVFFRDKYAWNFSFCSLRMWKKRHERWRSFLHRFCTNKVLVISSSCFLCGFQTFLLHAYFFPWVCAVIRLSHCWSSYITGFSLFDDQPIFILFQIANTIHFFMLNLYRCSKEARLVFLRFPYFHI